MVEDVVEELPWAGVGELLDDEFAHGGRGWNTQDAFPTGGRFCNCERPQESHERPQEQDTYGSRTGTFTSLGFGFFTDPNQLVVMVPRLELHARGAESGATVLSIVPRREAEDGGTVLRVSQ